MADERNEKEAMNVKEKGQIVTEEMKRSGDQYRKRLYERTKKNNEKKR